MVTNSRLSIQTRDAKIIAGIQKRLLNVPSVVLAGVTYTPAALTALFQSHIDAANAVDTVKGQWKNAVVAYRTLSKTVTNAVVGLREIVRQMFNNAPDALADFGFAPKKTTPRTPVVKVAAAVKNRATRAARNTVGSKKKLAIKGAVTPSEIGAAVTAELEPGANGASAANGNTPPAANAPAPEPGALHA